MQRPDLRYLVGLSLLPGIGPARFTRLLDHYGDAERAWRAPEADLVALGVDAKTLPALLERRRTLSLEKELERLRRLEVGVIARSDPEYPTRLGEIFNA